MTSAADMQCSPDAATSAMKDSEAQIVRGPAAAIFHAHQGESCRFARLKADLEAASRRYMMQVMSVYSCQSKLSELWEQGRA